MNWGKGITIAFILFGAYISYLVYRCFDLDFELEDKNYYEKELAFQDQIDGESNAKSEGKTLQLTTIGGKLSVDLPAGKDHAKGEVYLLRPSNGKYDKHFQLATDGSGHQEFSLDGMMPGLYNVKVSWECNGKPYFSQETIVF